MFKDPGSTFAATSPDPSEDVGGLGWSTVFQTAPGVGVLAAVLAAALLPRGRRAWGAAAVALVGIIIAQAPVLDSVPAQAAQRYLVVALAGLAVGVAAAEIWRQRWPAVALVAGAALALLLSSPLNALAGYDALPRYLAEYIEVDYALSPWWWLLAAAGVLAVAVALTGDGAGRSGAGLPPRTLAAGVLVAVGGIASLVAAGEEPFGWGRVVAGLAVVFAALALAAGLLPGRDGGFLFAMLAVGVVAAPVGVEVTLSVVFDVRMQERMSQWAMAAVLAAAAALIGCGAWAGTRWPRPAVGLGLLAIVALLGIPDPADPLPMTIARLLLVAVAAGLALAATRPAAAASGAMGVVGLFALTAPVALAVSAVSFGWVAYTPLTDGAESVEGDRGLSSTAVYLVIAAVVLACGAGAELIHRRQWKVAEIR